MYRIVFLGLVNFFELDEQQGRLVLVPDGSDLTEIDPGHRIDLHHASLFIQETDIIDRSNWWPNREEQEIAGLGVRELGIDQPSYVAISGMEPDPDPEPEPEPESMPISFEEKTNRRSGTSPQLSTKLRAGEPFDDSEFEEKLVRLRDINPAILIEPNVARTIAQIPIRRGKLASRLIGKAIVAQLEVTSHRGPITITATLDDGSGTKTLELRDGTEIVLANISNNLGHASNEPEASHFRIYAQLDSHRRADLLPAPKDEEIENLDLLLIDSMHPYINHLINLGVTPDGQCSITGCCRCASQTH